MLFRSITARNNLTLNIELRSGGDIRVFVKGQINIGTGFIIERPQGGQIKDVYFETHYGLNVGETDPAMVIGRNARLRGTFYAPYGDIGNSNNSSFDGIMMYGSLYSGGNVYVHNNSVVRFVRSRALWDENR